MPNRTLRTASGPRSSRVLVSMLVALAATLLGSAGPARAQTKGTAGKMPSASRPKPAHELKLATLAPEGSTWMNILRDLDNEVRTATENRVGFKFYPGGVQGEELTALKKIRLGQLHGGGFSGRGLGEIAPELRVLELPFLYKSSAEVDYVHAKLDPALDRLVEEKGFVILGWTEVGFIYLFTNRPVASPEDLKQVKMWLWEGDPLATAFFAAYGISPVPLSITDVLTSLQTRLVSGVYSSPLACIALQWNTRVSHMTDVRLTHGTAAVVLDKKAWDKIDAQDRTVVHEIARRQLQRLSDQTRIDNDKSITVMKERGMQIVTVDPAKAAEFEAIGKRMWKEQAGKLYPATLLADVEQAVADARQGKPLPVAGETATPNKANAGAALTPKSGH
jgi:TRAP-type C4-dicarboxylate transport system substrate-binding protein